MKKAAFFDLDKTIFNDHTFFLFLQYEIENGRLTESAWAPIGGLLKKYESGELSYKDAANEMLVSFTQTLKGFEYQDLLADAKKFFIENKDGFYKYWIEGYKVLSETHDIFLITTNTQFIAEAIVEMFSLKGSLSTELEVENGLFTGTVLSSLADGKEGVLTLLEQYGKEGSLAFGDSENDASMLELVETAVCIDPNENLEKIAETEDWVKTTHQEARSFMNFS